MEIFRFVVEAPVFLSVETAESEIAAAGAREPRTDLASLSPPIGRTSHPEVTTVSLLLYKERKAKSLAREERKREYFNIFIFDNIMALFTIIM